MNLYISFIWLVAEVLTRYTLGSRIEKSNKQLRLLFF